eukprot:6197264-Pleurochrysis_carterae.AAC.2
MVFSAHAGALDHRLLGESAFWHVRVRVSLHSRVRMHACMCKHAHMHMLECGNRATGAKRPGFKSGPRGLEGPFQRSAMVPGLFLQANDARAIRNAALKMASARVADNIIRGLECFGLIPEGWRPHILALFTHGI